MGRKNKKSVKERIDIIDQQIIKMLQIDGRLSNTVIAKKLSISEATVRNRLNRLVDNEYIQIVAVSNPLKLGFKISGVIRITVDISKIDPITESLKKIDPLWFIVHSTGNSDIYGEFVVKSIDELNDLLYKKINKINGVIRTETSLILKFIKRRYDWGTGFE